MAINKVLKKQYNASCDAKRVYILLNSHTFWCMGSGGGGGRGGQPEGGTFKKRGGLREDRRQARRCCERTKDEEGVDRAAVHGTTTPATN